jgi:hypothetical protein
LCILFINFNSKEIMKNVAKNRETLCQKLGTDFNIANLLFGAGRLNGIQMSQVWGSGGPTDAPTYSTEPTPTPTPNGCNGEGGWYNNYSDVPIPTRDNCSDPSGQVKKYTKVTKRGESWYVVEVNYASCSGHSSTVYYSIVNNGSGCWSNGGETSRP